MGESTECFSARCGKTWLFETSCDGRMGLHRCRKVFFVFSVSRRCLGPHRARNNYYSANCGCWPSTWIIAFRWLQNHWTAAEHIQKGCGVWVKTEDLFASPQSGLTQGQSYGGDDASGARSKDSERVTVTGVVSQRVAHYSRFDFVLTFRSLLLLQSQWKTDLTRASRIS